MNRPIFTLLSIAFSLSLQLGARQLTQAHVIVMGYRDTAGTACPSNGIICLDQEQMIYADRSGENSNRLYGLPNTFAGAAPSTVSLSTAIRILT